MNPYTTLAGEPLPAVSLNRVAIVVNPVAGNGSGMQILNRVAPRLENAGAAVQVMRTCYAGHARQIASQADLSGVDCLCVIGGDGTTHEIINGLLSRPESDDVRSRLVVGLIPGGSGNTLAHDLNIPSPEAFARRFHAGTLHAVDAVEISTPGGPDAGVDPDSAPGSYPQRYFSINMVGWGLPAQVLRTANRLRWSGGARYNIAAYLTLFRNVGYKGRVTLVDGHGEQTTVAGSYVMVQAQNTVHMGEKLPFCPRARLDDGLVDLVLIRHATRIALVKLMARARSGTHVEEDIVSYFQCRSFTLFPDHEERFAGSGSVNVDGELTGRTPMAAKVLPGAVRFVTG